eukprot:6491973-Amphidinium_carterae.2
MSKLCATIKEAQLACNEYFFQHGVKVYPVVGSNNMFSICRDDGKVVKPPCFRPPNLKRILDAVADGACCLTSSCCSVPMCARGIAGTFDVRTDSVLNTSEVLDAIYTHEWGLSADNSACDMNCIDPDWYSSPEETELPHGHREKHSCPPLWCAMVTLNISPKDPRLRDEHAKAATLKELSGLIGRAWNWNEAIEMVDAKRDCPKAHFARVFLLIGIKHSEDSARRKYKARAVFGGHAIRDGAGQAAIFKVWPQLPWKPLGRPSPCTLFILSPPSCRVTLLKRTSRLHVDLNFQHM